ncbi:MAG TPA: hypothetical protein VKB93_27490 [Thermoanaerobaculia bacterium]|nr:hypothetical protein [Thermoanaerobaculia bacterium]
MPELKIERFLDQLVVGGVVALGTWYLHRPFFQRYFPTVVGGTAATGGPAETEFLLLLFALVSVTIGILITHSADIAVVAIIDQEEVHGETSARRRWLRRFAVPFTWGPKSDPRLEAIRRYMNSKLRHDKFEGMLAEWAFSSEDAIRERAEAIRAHGHIVARLRALGSETRREVTEQYEPVLFAASLFLALVSLFVVALLSFGSNNPVLDPQSKAVLIRPLSVEIRIFITMGLYVAAAIAGLSLRRRFRDFSANVLTVALHHYAIAPRSGPVA